MRNPDLQNIPIEGKTYTLFGDPPSTNEYYKIIKKLADGILDENPDINFVINTIIRYSSKKSYLKTILKKPVPGNLISDILNSINAELEQYTRKTNEHLKNLSLSKIWDKRLSTTREQYHLYMLEIELTNRLNVINFDTSDRRIALLPHCLRDLTVNCKSAKNGFDYQCKHCSLKCYQNAASSVLKKNLIEPYIWMGGDFKKLAKATIKEGKRFSVLGIACIPELVMGMRKCRKYGIPVVGIPLNANRCRRWFGEFFPNSINLEELEKLVAK